MAPARSAGCSEGGASSAASGRSLYEANRCEGTACSSNRQRSSDAISSAPVGMHRASSSEGRSPSDTSRPCSNICDGVVPRGAPSRASRAKRPSSATAVAVATAPSSAAAASSARSQPSSPSWRAATAALARSPSGRAESARLRRPSALCKRVRFHAASPSGATSMRRSPSRKTAPGSSRAHARSSGDGGSAACTAVATPSHAAIIQTVTRSHMRVARIACPCHNPRLAPVREAVEPPHPAGLTGRTRRVSS